MVAALSEDMLLVIRGATEVMWEINPCCSGSSVFDNWLHSPGCLGFCLLICFCFVLFLHLMTSDSLIIPSSAHWFRENNKRNWLFWFWTKSRVCFHCNSRHCLILCSEAIGVKTFILQVYFLTMVHGKVIFQEQDNRILTGRNWNKKRPVPWANRVGIPFQSFVLCKGHFCGVRRSCLWDRHTWNSGRLPYHQVISMPLFE